MRSSFHLLVFFAKPLLGRGDLGHAEICGLGASLVPPGGPVCLTDRGYLAVGHHNATADHAPAESPQCQDGGCGGSPRQHNWTHSSPCFQGDEAESQIICVFTDATFAGGRGISLVTSPQRANYLATTPAFAEPETVKGINQDLGQAPPAKYEMRELPGKGMGLIATAHIRRGDLITANTASLMIDYRAFNELTKPQYTTLQAHGVNNLPLAHRTLLLNLSTHTPTDSSSASSDSSDSSSHHPAQPPHIELVDHIAATNSFDIDPDALDADQHHSFFALFPSVARLNHACRPNAEYRFDHASLTQHVHAARDIAPGEELTLSYIDPVQSRAARRQRLRRNWGFDCDCAACMAGDARVRESDTRVEQILKVMEELRDWAAGSRACPEMAELLVGLYEMEEMWGVMHEAYMLAALEYNAVGDPWTAVRYARRAVEWGIPMLGEGDEDVVALRELAEDPWAHWSWEKRLRGKG